MKLDAITFAAVVYIIAVLALLVGWVMNIVALVQMDQILTGMGIARIAGIFAAPLGGVLGYF